MVAFGHFKTDGFLSGLTLASTSYRFVDFFFVLSGFVIAHSSTTRLTAEPGPATRSFLIRRIARLWPLHVFVLVLFMAHQSALLVANKSDIVASPMAFTGDFAPEYLVPNLLLVQAWGFLPQSSWNEPAWSISVEMFVYLLFALDAVVTRGRLWLLGPLTLAALLVAGLRPETMSATYDVALWRGILGFGIGVLCHRLWLRIAHHRVPCATLCEVAAASAMLGAIVLLPETHGVWLVPVFGVAVVLFAQEQGTLSRLLSGPGFALLGRLSYSIYLLHPFVLVGLFSAATLAGLIEKNALGSSYLALGPGVADLALLGYLALVITLSRWTYRFIELPGQRIGKRIAARRTAAEA